MPALAICLLLLLSLGAPGVALAASKDAAQPKPAQAAPKIQTQRTPARDAAWPLPPAALISPANQAAAEASPLGKAVTAALSASPEAPGLFATLPPQAQLAPYALFYQGLALYHAARFADALALLAPLAQADEALSPDAAWLAGLCAERAARPEAAIPLYDRFLSRAEGPRRSTILLRAATVTASQGDARAATTRLVELCQGLPSTEAARQGEELARALFAQGLTDYDPQAPANQLSRATTLVDKRQYDAAAPLLRGLLDTQTAPDILAKASFQMGKIAFAKRDSQNAVASFRAARLADPAGSQGPIARQAALHQARAHWRMNTQADFDILTNDLQTLAKTPGQDRQVTHEALRLLLLTRIERGLFEEAQPIARELADLPGDDEPLRHGRLLSGLLAFLSRSFDESVARLTPLTRMEDAPVRQAAVYWLGRAYQALGENAQAGREFSRAASEWPNTFHGRLSLAALNELGTTPPKPLPVKTSPDTQASVLALQRATLLTGAGLAELAERELAFQLAKNPKDQQIALAYARNLASQAKHQAAAGAIARAYPDYLLRGSAEDLGLLAELVYPRRYLGILRAELARPGPALAPEALVLAQIRQESFFQPHAKSPAGAVGLMQLLPATARETARKMGLPAANIDLVNPAENIRLGVGLLRANLADFNSVVLTLCAYNAGPTRAKTWKQGFGSIEEAMQIEFIPLSETRDYVKNILSCAAMYQSLHTQD